MERVQRQLRETLLPWIMCRKSVPVDMILNLFGDVKHESVAGNAIPVVIYSQYETNFNRTPSVYNCVAIQFMHRPTPSSSLSKN